MEVVAKLMNQHEDIMNAGAGVHKSDSKTEILTNGNSGGGGGPGSGGAGGGGDNIKNSPKEVRKDQRKIWKSWSWKHSPGKSESIEEEPDSPKKSLTSPTNSPKHQNHSPVRRKKNSTTPTCSPSKRSDTRSSAGARLYQIIDQFDHDTSDEEMQALIITNGRPASIHAIQSSSSNGKIHF